jgi:hypothetical protein
MTENPFLLINIHRSLENPGTKKYLPVIEKDLLKVFALQLNSMGHHYISLNENIDLVYLFFRDDKPPDHQSVNLLMGFPAISKSTRTVLLSDKYDWRRNLGFISFKTGLPARLDESSNSWIGGILGKYLKHLSAINKAYDDDLAIGFSFCFFKINH